MDTIVNVNESAEAPDIIDVNVENPDDNVEKQEAEALDYGAILQELNNKMTAILEENEKLKAGLNEIYKLNNNPPPPSEEAVDALTYEQLAEKLVASPDSYTSHYIEDIMKGAK